MKYHFVINGYAKDCIKQMQEQQAFKHYCLTGMEEGETIVYCSGDGLFQKIKEKHTQDAIILTAAEYTSEVFLQPLTNLLKEDEIYIFGSDYSAEELAVRAAARAEGSSAVSVHKLLAGEKPMVKKMVYSNHMEGTFLLERGPYCISLAKGMKKMPLQKGTFHICEQISCKEKVHHILSRQYYQEEEKGLEDAKIIIVAGRGIKKKENMELIERTAQHLGGEFGISRPAAMNAWGPMNRLIGVSGSMSSPDICITAGISGAAAFYAGIEKSKFIIAINNNEKAPIMEKADVAIVDDFQLVLETLDQLLSEQK